MKYIVKNTNTNEVAELDIDAQFIQDILEVNKIYVYEANCYIKATQEEINNYNIQNNNNLLTALKKSKKAEFEANYDKSKLDMIITQNNINAISYSKGIDWYLDLLPQWENTETSPTETIPNTNLPITLCVIVKKHLVKLRSEKKTLLLNIYTAINALNNENDINNFTTNINYLIPTSIRIEDILAS